MSCSRAPSPFLEVPEGLTFTPNSGIQDDPVRRHFIGQRLAVLTLTQDIVITEGDRSIAFGHEQGKFDPPLQVILIG